MISDQDKKLGVDSMGDFFKLFGPPDDVHSRVLLEVLFEELFGINSDKEVKNDNN